MEILMLLAPVWCGLLFWLLGEFVVWLEPPIWAQIVLTVGALALLIAAGLYLFKLITEE